MVDDFPPEIGRQAASEPDQAAEFSGTAMARKIA
jgi:hypothetical protein